MRKLHIAIAMIICCLAMTLSCLADYDRSVIQQVQEALNKMGYDCGTPDGIAGNRTTTAVTSYQQAHNLTADGQINDELLSSLGITVPENNNDASADVDTGVIGAVSDDVYRNDYFGFEFQGNGEWHFFSDEEIASVMGIVSSLLTEEDFEDQLEETGTVTACIASKNNDSRININIQIQDNSVLYGFNMSTDMLILLMKPQLESALASAGYSDLTTEQTDVVFAGETRSSVMIEGTFYGQKIYEQLILVDKDQYLALVTLTTVGENQISQAVLPYFQPIS